jgi:hypothetical protein
MPELHGPMLRDVVTLVVPKREDLQARVDDAAAGWIDLTLLTSPRTSWARLEHTQVSIHFGGAQGLCRLVGLLGHRPQDAGLRVVGYGAGEVLRLSHRGAVQLLRRPSEVRARINARIIVLRTGAPDHVAAEVRCVALSGETLRVRGLPFAARGQHFEFDLFLSEHEAPLRGEFRVERTDDNGVDARFSRLGAHDRGRLVQWAAHGGALRVA